MSDAGNDPGVDSSARGRLNLPGKIFLIALVLLSINPAFTQGRESINLLFCGALCLSPLVLLIKGTRVFIPKIDIPFGLVCFFVWFFPIVFHPESVRLSTMLFTCAYCFTFMMLARLLRISNIGIDRMLRVIRWVVYAYAFILICQQICIVTGLPLILRPYFYNPHLPFKLNSLSAEPSHTTMMLSVLVFFYACINNSLRDKGGFLNEIRRYPWFWAAYVWILFTTHNTSAFIMFPFSLLPYLRKESVLYVAGAAVVGVLLFTFLPLKENVHYQRLSKIGTSLTTLDEKRIIEADSSISARIVPTIRGVKSVDFRDHRLLTGYGVDADRQDIAPRPCDTQRRGFAGMLSMWHNYGALCALSFWAAIIILTLIRGRLLSILTFILAMLLSADYNMQLVWQLLAISMYYKYAVCGRKKLLDTYP